MLYAYSRDTYISALREYRTRLRADMAGEIPLCPDRDWNYEDMAEEEETDNDTLTIYGPA